ncbi:MAG: hypothetical protein KDK25_10185 [Leptospiraceae bacterium]|nr:hypothetical protein [Leptospiraceae bacterium]
MQRSLKFSAHIAKVTSILGLALIAFSCSLADIRPDSIKTEITGDQFKKGREILDRSLAAHGGAERWQKAGPVVVKFTDEWPGFLNRTLFMPWPENPMEATMYVLPHRDDARIVYRKGEESGHFMGIQHWIPYTGEAVSQAPVSDIASAAVDLQPEDDDIKFWVPTLNYFLQLPYRIGEADVVAYAGERKLDGRAFQLVFVSWVRAEPQEMVDQYLLWIEKKTGYIEYATYTVRDMGGFVTGTMHYSDFQEQNGLVIARKQAVIDSPEEPGEPLHQLTIEEMQFNAEVPDSLFYPRPQEKKAKY